jgi:lysozyme family protein
MADFRQAADFVLRNEDETLEGAVTPDPTDDDPHAVARFGVNSARHPEAIREGFYEMGRDAALMWAEDCFKFNYFSPIGGYHIVVQDVANKICDLAFNTGINQAVKIAQRAVNSCLPNLIPALSIDGIAGDRTIGTINACEPERLLPAIKEKAKDFYMMVVAAKPDKRKYLVGWLARVDKDASSFPHDHVAEGSS